MQVGFTIITEGNQVEFQLFEPAGDDRPALVTSYQTQDYTAVLLGRLHYREDLPPSPGASGGEDRAGPEQVNEAALAVALYRRFGLRGLERLEGSFALALWDAREGRLIALRDPMGAYPVFWAQTPTGFALGTSLGTLVRLLPGRSVDPDYLADYLLVAGSQSELPGERCVYQGVQRLQPGHLLTVRLPGGRVERRAYWDWLERLVDPGTDRLEEVAAQYGDRLRRAVRERLRGRVVSHLSGGMDSTAVALLARDYLRAGAGEGLLHTLTLVHERLAGLARERPYIDAVLGQPGLVPHRLAADDLLDFDVFADPPPHEEPYPGLWRLGMDRATVDAAAGLGGATLLTGIGADEMIDLAPLHLTDLLRRGRLWAAWKEACRWARASNCSPWTFLYPYGVANVFPAWSRVGLGRWFHPAAGLSTANEWAFPAWIRPGFARRYDLRGRAVTAIRRIFKSCRPTALSFAHFVISTRIGDAISWALAAPRGLAIAHPFLDPRVLCLGLGIQARVRAEPGPLKPILAEAMRDVLPEAIRNRRHKGHFNEVYYLGLSRNLPALEAMIRRAPSDDLGLVDKEALIQGLQKAALGGDGARPLQHLNLMLAFLKWLSMQKEWLARSQQPTAVLRAGRPTRPLVRRSA